MHLPYEKGVFDQTFTQFVSFESESLSVTIFFKNGNINQIRVKQGHEAAENIREASHSPYKISLRPKFITFQQIFTEIGLVESEPTFANTKSENRNLKKT